MTISDQLIRKLDTLAWDTASKFRRLPPELQAKVDRQYLRHLQACSRLEIAPDPLFIADAVAEAKREARV